MDIPPIGAMFGHGNFNLCHIRLSLVDRNEYLDMHKNPSVYIDPWSKDLYDNKLFEVGESDPRKDYLLPYIYLKSFCNKMGVSVETADKIPQQESTKKKYLYYSFGNLFGFNKIKDRSDIVFCSFYLFEPPIDVLPKKSDIYFHLSSLQSRFIRVYTTSPISAINNLYKTNYEFNTDQFNYPQSHDGPLAHCWNKNKRELLVMVNSYRYSKLKTSEFYSERLKTLKYFFNKNSIDLYGKDWDKLSGNFFINLIESFAWSIKWQSARRLKDFIYSLPIRKCLQNVKPSHDKYKTMASYKFAICYESMGIEGFVTEKIFECFFSGTIPIYLGDPNIDKKIPKNTFIDKRDFNNYDNLFDYISNMSEEDYNAYRNNIKRFLSSGNYHPFSKNYFAEQFYCDMLKDLNSLQKT